MTTANSNHLIQILLLWFRDARWRSLLNHRGGARSLNHRERRSLLNHRGCVSLLATRVAASLAATTGDLWPSPGCVVGYLTERRSL